MAMGGPVAESVRYCDAHRGMSGALTERFHPTSKKNYHGNISHVIPVMEIFHVEPKRQFIMRIFHSTESKHSTIEIGWGTTQIFFFYGASLIVPKYCHHIFSRF